ncbi:MAG: hypothetical protein SGILL_009336 [Bacillariaceae sp.]
MKEFEHIIHWMPSGKSFTVLKPKAFAVDILPDHFKSAKYSSFTRKLHRWGFTRHYKGDEAGAFYHKEFQKDRIDLAEKMTCHKGGESALAAVTSDSTPRATEMETPSVATNSAGNFSTLRQDSMPPVVRRASGAAGVMQQSAQALLLSHRPLLSIPVPKQQMHHSQHRQPQQQMALNIPEVSAQSALAAKINAAIELEVSRRLQQRITAAAAQMSQMPQGPAALNNLLPTPPQPAIRRPVAALDDATSSSESLRIKLLQMQQQKEQMQYLAMTGAVRMPAPGLEELPKTNIQGAKTA